MTTLSDTQVKALRELLYEMHEQIRWSDAGHVHRPVPLYLVQKWARALDALAGESVRTSLVGNQREPKP